MYKQLWRVPIIIWAILLAALLVRIGLAVSIVGHPTDMTTFKAWAHYVAAHGFGHFYSGEIFADYPPGYIFVLYAIGKLKIWFDLDFNGKAFLLLVKTPAIAADLAASLLIYIAAAKRWRMAVAAGLTAAYAFNPAIIVNSSAWGQVDSVFTFFVAVFVLFAVRGKVPHAVVAFVIAVLIKPQGLIFTPVLLFAMYRNRNWKTLAWSAVGGLATFLVLIVPFGTGKGLFWIVDLYSKTLSSYPYASLNAFNLFALLGGNWQPVTTRYLFTYEMWGLLFIVLTVGYSLYLFIRNRRQSSTLLFISVVIIVLVFVCTAKMHERYLYPSLLLAMLSYLQLKDRRLLYLYIGLSATHFINVAYVLSFNVHEHYHLYRFDKVLLLTSAANVILIVYMAFIARGIGKEKPIAATVRPRMLRDPMDFRPMPEKPLARKDWLIIGIITLLYAIVAFIRLGDQNAPETYWKAKTDERVVLDLGYTASMQKINLYNGIGGGRYRIETSIDSTQWEPVTVPEALYGSVFTWNSIVEPHNGRYIKLTADSSDIRLMEIGVFVNGGQTPAPLQLVPTSTNGGVSAKWSTSSAVSEMDAGAGPEHLIDEQHAVPYIPSYRNSMYFDEIYHGRTAYEHIHLMEPYETTHPPIGKDIMTLGILGFGMNPFGWRIVGTIVGILMVPLMYVFAFRLFQRTIYATWAALLLVFDFMHFVQTRIGTVDVFTVFFVMLMFYFMYRYSRIDLYASKLSKSLSPLFLSGLFFGFGISSKWNAVYGGLGLALLLAFCLYRRHMEYRYALQMQGRLTKEDKLGVGVGIGAGDADGSTMAVGDKTGYGSRVVDGGKTSDGSRVDERGKTSEGSRVDDDRGMTSDGSKVDERGKTSEGSRVDDDRGMTSDGIRVGEDAEDGDDRWDRVVRLYKGYTVKTILLAGLFFTVIPLAVYVLSYIPFLMIPGPGHGLMDVVRFQKFMYDYHSKLVATHPFSSPWWSWMIMVKPVWYFSGQQMAAGKVSSIVAMGNPALWWGGIGAFVFAVYNLIRNKAVVMLVPVVAFVSLYVPWMLVPRLTFLYHFFPMMPFIILFVVYALQFISERYRLGRRISIGYIALAGLLFVMFYPVLSGMIVGKSYVNYVLRWFPSWIF